MDCIDRYFDDAVRIYAICGDEQLSDDEARLLTYMHAKGSESGKGIDYFNDPPACDKEALQIMTGEAEIRDITGGGSDEEVAKADTFVSSVVDRISSLDAALENCCGMESRISGELRGRLRLYKDAGFRSKMMELYSNKIAPRIFNYSSDDVARSFRRFREKAADTEQDIRRMIER